jgi:hypothetical protein
VEIPAPDQPEPKPKRRRRRSPSSAGVSDQGVETRESGGEVGADVPVPQLAADQLEVIDGEAGPQLVDERDDVVVGQDPKATP